MIGYLESATERYGAQIHCFCLMSNHYHLLLETPRGNLRQILHHLNTGYTNYFNAKTGRAGHLFQGRYRAILVDKDHYAMELSRYIHLNPVRAHMVKDPLLYPWSSYKDYAGERRGWNWVKTEWILGQISRNEKRARKGYRKFIGEVSGRAVRDPLEQVVSSAILGPEEFVDWVREKWVKKRAYHRDIPSLRQLSRWPSKARGQIFILEFATVVSPIIVLCTRGECEGPPRGLRPCRASHGDYAVTREIRQSAQK
jgi:putative transposase